MARKLINKLINAYMHASLVKLMVGFVIAMTIVLSISVNANATPKSKTKTRTVYGVVIDTSAKDNIAYIKTGDGNIWAYLCDDLDVGDVYKVTFNTHNTKKKTDDRIVTIRYIGYVFNVKNV